MSTDRERGCFCWLATRFGVEAQILHGFIQKEDKARMLVSRILADDETALSIDALAAKYPPPRSPEQ